MLANAATGIMVLCAVVITVLVVRREFSRPAAPSGSNVTILDDWEFALAGGQAIGDQGALYQVVEFIDFQCPFCRQAADGIDRLLEQYPEQLRVVYQHYPIQSIHPWAFEAGVAAECAAEEGRFKAYHDALYASPGEIGAITWSDFAKRADIADVDGFESCLETDGPRQRVMLGKAIGDSIGVRGTPAMIIDGKLIGGLPALDTLAARLELLDLD
jgi:protein-disulfide isomerase